MRTHVLHVGRVNAFFILNRLCLFHFCDERFQPHLLVFRVIHDHIRFVLPRFDVGDVRGANVVAPLIAPAFVPHSPTLGFGGPDVPVGSATAPIQVPEQTTEKAAGKAAKATEEATKANPAMQSLSRAAVKQTSATVPTVWRD